jgi:hypothetical protein
LTSITFNSRLLHVVTLACGLALAAPAMAQSPSPLPPPAPPATVPPPLPDVSGDPELEPQITIRRTDTETIEEARINGELRYLKVTPRGGGRPYYLIPSGNGQTFIRRESLDIGLRVPMWLLFSW